MKVKELIELLQQHDQESRVVIPGYEGGYNDISGANSYDICLNVYDQWYYGDHELITETVNHRDYQIEKAVILD